MTVVTETLEVRTKVHLWWTWLRIAAEQVGHAMRARNGQASPTSFESHESAMLSEEFRSSIVAISAVAFALEAIDKELKRNGFELDRTQVQIPVKTNAGFYVAHRLLQAFGLSGEFAQELPTELESIFQLRNDSVHFESDYRDGVHNHPNGNQTAYELTLYTLERCVAALSLATSLLQRCAKAADEGRAHNSAEYIVVELPGVLKMLAEVVEARGLKEQI